MRPSCHPAHFQNIPQRLAGAALTGVHDTFLLLKGNLVSSDILLRDNVDVDMFCTLISGGNSVPKCVGGRVSLEYCECAVVLKLHFVLPNLGNFIQFTKPPPKQQKSIALAKSESMVPSM